MWEIIHRIYPYEEVHNTHKLMDSIASGYRPTPITCLGVPEAYTQVREPMSGDCSTSTSYHSVRFPKASLRFLFVSLFLVDDSIRPSVGDHSSERPLFLSNSLADTITSQLMERCWAQEPRERPSFAVIVPDLESLQSQ